MVSVRSTRACAHSTKAPSTINTFCFEDYWNGDENRPKCGHCLCHSPLWLPVRTNGIPQVLRMQANESFIACESRYGWLLYQNQNNRNAMQWCIRHEPVPYPECNYNWPAISVWRRSKPDSLECFINTSEASCIEVRGARLCCSRPKQRELQRKEYEKTSEKRPIGWHRRHCYGHIILIQYYCWSNSTVTSNCTQMKCGESLYGINKIA